MWAPSKERGAYDFEAWAWVNPRCCGLLWGASGERSWRFVLDPDSSRPDDVPVQVLHAMLEVAEGGGPRDWWAHNGGKYDVCFLLDAVVRLGWAVTGFVAAGRAVVLHVKSPKSKTVLRLFDSMALVPSSLRSAAQDFELEAQKLLTKDDYSLDVRQWSRERLESGCRADCEVVLQLVDRVEAMLEGYGGGLRATFASAAMSVLEARTELPDLRNCRAWNATARKAYCGGRVEVFHHMPARALVELDVNSSYPWSMTQKLPLRPLGPAAHKRQLWAVLDGEKESGVVHATVTVPESMEVPPLPFIHPEGGMFFPTGSWRAWFAAPELKYAASIGVKVVPHEALRFTAELPFWAFVDELYRLKSESTGAKKSLAKFLLNSCYGKFGQRPERENLRVFHSREEGQDFMLGQAHDTCRPLGRHADGFPDERFMAVKVERWAKRTHYALAACVTAHSRVLLHRALVKAESLAYCDTDSVHAGLATRELVETGAALGQLKVEVPLLWARYYAPKLYELHPAADGAPHYACKGFPVTEADFRRAVAMEAVRVERMTLVKAQLKSPSKRAARGPSQRFWAGHSTKRCPLSGGGTRPWSAAELQANAHVHARSPLAEWFPE
jgi:hypothetical protein